MLVDILAVKITGSANVECVGGIIIAFHASEIASLDEVFAVPITEWSPTIKYVEESHHVHENQLLALFRLQRIKETVVTHMCAIFIHLHVFQEILPAHSVLRITIHFPEKMFY